MTVLSLSAMILLIAGVCFPSNALAQSSGLSPEGQQLLSLLNAQRSAAGLSALIEQPLLDQAAQAHADDILYNHNYSHWGSDGTLPENRVARTGYSDTPWVSENWVTSRSPDAAMRWWMNDYIHRVNIQTPRWVEVGIGAAVNWDSGEMVFVTVFSAGRDAEGAYVTSTAGPAPIEVQSVDVPPGGLEYSVQAGDTLLGIGMRHGVDYEVVAAVNGLSESSLLQIGQVLHIPGDPDAVAQNDSVSLGVGGPVQIETVDYRIAPGDTLVSIAMKTGNTWRQLAAINGLGEHSLLQIDDVIQVPAETDDEEAPKELTGPPVVSDAPEADESPIVPDTATNEIPAAVAVVAASMVSETPDTQRRYTVQPGDTLIGIAVKNDVDLSMLMLMNSLGEDTLLQLGQEIQLP